MANKDFVQGFVESFLENVPPALAEFKGIMVDHARQACESALDEMGVVSREEFDTQVLMLRKAREKLDKLELILKKVQI
tara:strand:- start:138 stop:374 length:237 start_codon:yes stop_codon:yes gene_type:complete